MNVLSLFDGMSCGQLALERANIKYDKYFASEINPASIQITQKNYPDTIQLGDVTKLIELDKDGNVIKISETLKRLPRIDLLIGGSPCQNLSRVAADRQEISNGLQGEKSSLFHEYRSVLKWLRKNNNKNIKFLLENVASMEDEDRDAITKYLDVEPIKINSNLVSAQDRERYYWTNIDVRELPKDKGLVLKDIMLTKEEVHKLENGRMKFWYDRPFDYNGEDKKVIATLHMKGHEQMKRVYNPNNKCATLTACRGGNLQKKVFQDGRCRKLTPLEYERLQTVPDNYTEGVANTDRYNMLGDGWTVDVIAHILRCINN